jgi:aminoglycoside phosphotransferase (APT) family kinase protein
MLYRPVELSPDEVQARLAPLAVTGIRALSGGASSLTYAGTASGGRQVVVKVAPAGVPPVLNRDVLRQARLLRALQGTAVPVPRVLWEDGGDPPEVPPLFVMSFVPGTSFEPLFDLERDGDERHLDAGDAGDDDGNDDDDIATVSDRMRSAVRAMVALHALDPDAVGLGDEPVVGPSAEVERWCRLLETVDPGAVPDWEGVAAALRAAEPPGLPGAVVHGDFRLGNMLAAGPEITAVVDWEIWTIGDPRVDLGWFLVNADPDTYRRPTRFAGALPAPAELAALYGDVPDLDWFVALACFKSTATWSLIVKHNRRRPEPDPELEEMAAVLPHLLDRARAYLSPAGSL